MSRGLDQFTGRSQLYDRPHNDYDYYLSDDDELTDWARRQLYQSQSTAIGRRRHHASPGKHCLLYLLIKINHYRT